MDKLPPSEGRRMERPDPSSQTLLEQIETLRTLTPANQRMLLKFDIALDQPDLKTLGFDIFDCLEDIAYAKDPTQKLHVSLRPRYAILQDQHYKKLFASAKKMPDPFPDRSLTVIWYEMLEIVALERLLRSDPTAKAIGGMDYTRLMERGIQFVWENELKRHPERIKSVEERRAQWKKIMDTAPSDKAKE